MLRETGKLFIFVQYYTFVQCIIHSCGWPSECYLHDYWKYIANSRYTNYYFIYSLKPLLWRIMQERDLCASLSNPFTIQNVEAFRETAYWAPEGPRNDYLSIWIRERAFSLLSEESFFLLPLHAPLRNHSLSPVTWQISGNGLVLQKEVRKKFTDFQAFTFYRLDR